MGHAVLNCPSKYKCKECRRRHNTLLHVPTVSSVDVPPGESSTQEMSTQHFPSAAGTWSTVASVASQFHCPLSVGHHAKSKSKNEFIMPTALIQVKNRYGLMVNCRALLDSASKLSYITENCAQRLGLARFPSKILVSGISSVKAETSHGSCHIRVKSRVSENVIDAVVHVLSNITSKLPSQSFQNQSANYLKDLPLADPYYNVSSPINILFGLEHIWSILTFQKRFDSQGNTIAISSIFGWVITYTENFQSL